MPRGYGGYLDLTIETFNELVGGLPLRSALGIFGPPAAGKTILIYQLAYEVMAKRGGNAFILDTEGSVATYAEWQPKFSKRYDLDTELCYLLVNRSAKDITLKPEEDPSEDKHTIFVVDERSIERLLELHGRGMNFDTEGKKFKLTPNQFWEEDLWETPMGDWVSRNDIRYLAYDSVSNPLRKFGNEQQQLPPRNNATNQWMLQLQTLTQELDLATVTVHHRSGARPGSFDPASVTGGDAIFYNHKYLVGIIQRSQNAPGEEGKRTPSPSKKASKDKHPYARYVWLERHTSRAPRLRMLPLALKNDGYADMEDDE